MKQKSDCSFLVVGVVRNGAHSIQKDVARITSAIGDRKDLYWFVVESDSDDDTAEILDVMSRESDRFRYATLGKLRDQKPLRTDRIAHCRNAYLDEIKNNQLYSSVDFVVVADLDQLNTDITKLGFESCWFRDGWDMCAANQDAPYYDIWALRHKEWSPNDCWAQFEFFKRYSKNREKNLQSSVYSRMIKIPSDSEWIEVDSAFGGLAVYKRSFIVKGVYSGLNSLGKEVCEHVHFNSILRNYGAKLFINPKLINAKYTGLAERLKPYENFKRKLRTIRNDSLIILLGESRFNTLIAALKGLGSQ